MTSAFERDFATGAKCGIFTLAKFSEGDFAPRLEPLIDYEARSSASRLPKSTIASCLAKLEFRFLESSTDLWIKNSVASIRNNDNQRFRSIV